MPSFGAKMRLSGGGIMTIDRPRLLIAGTGSGCGKTSVVCALLQALKDRGLGPRSFKCGPDYIDPMFHTGILGVESVNLDLFFSGKDGARSLLARYGGEVNVIEGVMGLYDGLAMDSPEASAWDVARTLDAPTVLVVNVRGMALSAAAVVKGYMTLREPTPIRGVIFNRATPMSYPGLKAAVEKECGVPVFGFLPACEEAALESRHLGLVTAGEVEDLRGKMRVLGAAAEKSLDLDGLLALMRSAAPLEAEPVRAERLGSVRIAVARDKAFCFYYRDNFALLGELGAELVPFSPLEDEALPPCDGLYMGGGYPELYTERLSANASMRRSIRAAVESGLPTVAECGAFMYLCREIDGVPMAGVIDTVCVSAGKLVRFGYKTLTASSESLLFAPGDSVRAHEFHYWDAEDPGSALQGVKPSGREDRCAYAGPTLYAGFPHLYFRGSGAAQRFVRKCMERKNGL